MYRFKNITNKFYFSSSYLAKLQKLHKQKRFAQILGINEDVPFGTNINKNQLRKTYLNLIKQYHSDKCHHNPQMAKQYEQISKLIISAYYNLQKIVNVERQYKKHYQMEDDICQTLFGQTYHEAKYKMYEPGNQNMRQRFVEQLARRTGKTYRKQQNKSWQPKPNRQGTPFSSNNNTQQQKNSPAFMLAFGSFIILGIGMQLYTQAKPPQIKNSKPILKYEQYGEKIKQISAKRAAKVNQKANAMIKILLKDQPPCLKYPKEEPDLFTQLTEYSIAPDVHLYEAPTKYYEKQFMDQIKNNPNLIKEQQLFRIKRIKPNTSLTLSLEAERALHNVYVKVRDVIKQIQKTGKYNPPKVFTKFHGYIMVQIRDKPISLRNYKNTQYVSLFDLYFDYYSPIFLKRDNFCQYLVGKDQPQLFGWVHLNNRKCKPVYLKNNQKYAYFIPVREVKWEGINRKIWDNYYQKYQERWKPGGNTKSKMGI